MLSRICLQRPQEWSCVQGRTRQIQQPICIHPNTRLHERLKQSPTLTSILSPRWTSSFTHAGQSFSFNGQGDHWLLRDFQAPGGSCSEPPQKDALEPVRSLALVLYSGINLESFTDWGRGLTGAHPAGEARFLIVFPTSPSPSLPTAAKLPRWDSSKRQIQSPQPAFPLSQGTESTALHSGTLPVSPPPPYPHSRVCFQCC